MRLTPSDSSPQTPPRGLCSPALGYAGPRLARLPGSVQSPAAYDSQLRYLHVHAGQLARFTVIGVAIAFLNLCVLYVLRARLGFSAPMALTIMYLIGVAVHFPAHRTITYHVQDQPPGPQALRYAVMLLWNFAVMQGLAALTSHAGVSLYIAVIAATGVNMILNFLFMTHVVFVRSRR